MPAIREEPAARGIGSIIIGLVCIMGGVTGKLTLRFTDSGYALAGSGVLLIGLGSYRSQ